jgi:hypothetical protein
VLRVFSLDEPAGDGESAWSRLLISDDHVGPHDIPHRPEHDRMEIRRDAVYSPPVLQTSVVNHP